MKLRKHTGQDEDKGLSLTSLIDVTFLLLIFFLLTLNFRTLDGKLATHLPKGQGPNSNPADVMLDVEIVIRVVDPGRRVEPGTAVDWDGEGRYDYVGRVVSYATGPHPTTDVSVLGQNLARLRDGDPERKLKITAKAGTVVRDTVVAMDVAIQAGYQDITFAGAR